MKIAHLRSFLSQNLTFSQLLLGRVCAMTGCFVYDIIVGMKKEFNIPENIPEKSRAELEKLLRGNRNFVNGTPTAQNICLQTLKKFAFHQEPFAVLLSCSDSRVVPEIIFDCGIGEIFVVRTAGITTGPNIIESIEYAVNELNVPLVVLLGHDDCGVMKYANGLHPGEPEKYKSIVNCVYPVLEKMDYRTHANKVARAHTHHVESVLMERSEILREAVESGRTYIANCHFDHSTGYVDLID
jgi:carbonic anhydrase